MFDGWPLERVCHFVRELGYDGVELAPFTLGREIVGETGGLSPQEISAARRQVLRSTIEEAGLSCVGLHWLLAGTQGIHLTSPDPATRDAAVCYLSDLASLCADLGGKVMVFGSPKQRSIPAGSNWTEAWAAATDVFARVLPALEEHNVTLAIEPLGAEETDFVNSADEAVRMIRQLNSPHVRLLLDMKAMATEKFPMPELIAQHSDVLVHFHANDPNRQGPGMGSVPVRPVLDSLQQAGYDGWVSVEVFDLSPGPEKLAEESLRNLRAALN